MIIVLVLATLVCCGFLAYLLRLSTSFALIVLFIGTWLSLPTSYIMREKYDLIPWRNLPSDAWSLEAMDRIALVALGFLALLLMVMALEILASGRTGVRPAKVDIVRGPLIGSALTAGTLLVGVYVLLSVPFFWKLGITGINTPTQYSLSGLTYYLRFLLGPIVFAAVFWGRRLSVTTFLLISLLALGLGIFQASRLLFVICVVSGALGLSTRSLLRSVIAFSGTVLIGFIVLTEARAIFFENLDQSAMAWLFGVFTRMPAIVAAIPTQVMDYLDVIFLRIGGIHEYYWLADYIYTHAHSCTLSANLIYGPCQSVISDIFGGEFNGTYGMNLSVPSNLVMLSYYAEYAWLAIYLVQIVVVNVIYMLVIEPRYRSNPFVAYAYVVNLFLGHFLLIGVVLATVFFLQRIFTGIDYVPLLRAMAKPAKEAP